MHEHTPTLTERRIDAMMGLLRDNKRHLWKTDENRRTIESMTPQMYEGSGYYERWVRSMRGLLIEKGVLTEAEIEARLQDVRARFAGQAATAMPAKPAKSVKASKPGVRPSRGAK
jgi:nitrile hydratase subunit beta